MNRSRRTSIATLSLALTLAALAAMPAGPALRGDEQADALAKYRQPVDAAIDAALAYLAKAQLADGAFPGGMPKSTAVTSLAVMAFLAKGHSPGCGPYGEVIDKGIDQVLAHQQTNGYLVAKDGANGPMYSHCIATLMLSEVSGMVSPDRQKRLDPALAKALKLILTAQQVKKPPKMQGGWRYQHSSPDSDISCSGWAMMALRSARNAGAAVPREAIDQAMTFFLNCRNPDGGFGYTPGGQSGLARTGTGLLCLELSGRHRDDTTSGAGDWILKNLPRNFGAEFFYYGLYYSSQGMFQLGQKHWDRWGEHMYQMMLKFQQKDGSWPAGTASEAPAGPCYSTAMAVLAMSVSYRQLPIYQR